MFRLVHFLKIETNILKPTDFTHAYSCVHMNFKAPLEKSDLAAMIPCSLARTG